MRKWIVFLALCIPFYTWGQTITLSAQAEVSVITCGRDAEEVYSAFGHNAIRVVDPINRIDYAYNYGVFDFSQPNFYLNYTKGLLLFKLGVYAYPDFVNSYAYHNRWVTEQILNLSQKQKQNVFNYLEWNALPGNETYRYDYFYNNCANKVRDVFVQVLKDSIRFDSSYITTDYTIRQLTDLYLTDQPWGDLGIDICLGLPMDKKATPYEYMFIPDYVESSFDHANILRNGEQLPLVKKKVPAFVNAPIKVSKAPVSPWMALGGFFALTLGLSYYDLKRKKASHWFDTVLFTLLGAVGVLLLLLWTATDHAAAAKNFNLLWALPTHLVVLGVLSKRTRPFLRTYFRVIALASVVLLGVWVFLPQQMHPVLLLLVGAIAIRAYVLSRWLS